MSKAYHGPKIDMSVLSCMCNIFTSFPTCLEVIRVQSLTQNLFSSEYHVSSSISIFLSKWEHALIIILYEITSLEERDSLMLTLIKRLLDCLQYKLDLSMNCPILGDFLYSSQRYGIHDDVLIILNAGVQQNKSTQIC